MPGIGGGHGNIGAAQCNVALTCLFIANQPLMFIGCVKKQMSLGQDFAQTHSPIHNVRSQL